MFETFTGGSCRDKWGLSKMERRGEAEIAKPMKFDLLFRGSRDDQGGDRGFAHHALGEAAKKQ